MAACDEYDPPVGPAQVPSLLRIGALAGGRDETDDLEDLVDHLFGRDGAEPDSEPVCLTPQQSGSPPRHSQRSRRPHRRPHRHPHLHRRPPRSRSRRPPLPPRRRSRQPRRTRRRPTRRLLLRPSPRRASSSRGSSERWGGRTTRRTSRRSPRTRRTASASRPRSRCFAYPPISGPLPPHCDLSPLLCPCYLCAISGAPCMLPACSP